MNEIQEQKKLLQSEVEKLHQRNLLSKTVSPNYFEPGMMEYLEQSDGMFDEKNGRVIIQFEAKGTKYEGRTEQIEKVKMNDIIQVVREYNNSFNTNNFTLLTQKGKNVGNMPAELCDAIAPLYDQGKLVFEEAVVSFVEPISKRSRHAKQAILFVRLQCRLLG